MRPPVLNLIQQGELDDRRVTEYMAEGLTRDEAWSIATAQRRLSLLAQMDMGPTRKRLLTEHYVKL